MIIYLLILLIYYLRSGHQIHFQQLGLERTFGGSVILQGIQQEGSAGLDHVLLEEDVDNLRNVGQRLVVLDEHLGKHGALLGADAHHAAKQEDVVGRVADLLGVEDDLLELARFGEALDDFVGHVGSQVDGKGQSRIGLLDQIAQLFRALQFVFLQPLFQQLLATLLQDGAAQFQRLKLVQLTLI